MKKYLILVAIAALLLPSCRGAVEKARRNIRVEAVEAVERKGFSGFDLTLRVKNDTRYRLQLDTAAMELFYIGSPILSIALREGIEIPKRTTMSVTARWRLRIVDPIGLYVAGKKFEEGDLAPFSITYLAEGRGGPAKVEISRDMVPLSQFLATFGLSVEDLTKYLK